MSDALAAHDKELRACEDELEAQVDRAVALGLVRDDLLREVVRLQDVIRAAYAALPVTGMTTVRDILRTALNLRGEA